MNDLKLLFFEMPELNKISMLVILLLPILFLLFGIPYILGPLISIFFIVLFIGSMVIKDWEYKKHIQPKLVDLKTNIEDDDQQYYDNYFHAKNNAITLCIFGIIFFIINIILIFYQSVFVYSTSSLGWACWILASNYNDSALRNISKILQKNE